MSDHEFTPPQVYACNLIVIAGVDHGSDYEINLDNTDTMWLEHIAEKYWCTEDIIYQVAIKAATIAASKAIPRFWWSEDVHIGKALNIVRNRGNYCPIEPCDPSPVNPDNDACRSCGNLDCDANIEGACHLKGGKCGCGNCPIWDGCNLRKFASGGLKEDEE